MYQEIKDYFQGIMTTNIANNMDIKNYPKDLLANIMKIWKNKIKKLCNDNKNP